MDLRILSSFLWKGRTEEFKQSIIDKFPEASKKTKKLLVEGQIEMWAGLQTQLNRMRSHVFKVCLIGTCSAIALGILVSKIAFIAAFILPILFLSVNHFLEDRSRQAMHELLNLKEEKLEDRSRQAMHELLNLKEEKLEEKLKKSEGDEFLKSLGGKKELEVDDNFVLYYTTLNEIL